MIIDEVRKIIEMPWCKETCSPSLKDKWDDNNKALGQCAVTALIVNDFVGGTIMRCMCESGSHYYNLIEHQVVDLTAQQFNEKVDYTNGESRTREYLLSNEDTRRRYMDLLEKVKDNFIKYGDKNYRLLTINGEYLSKIPGTCGGHKKLKIYGKLDCPNASRWLRKGYYENNRVFFESSRHAEELGYRPCSVCMKKEYKKWEESKMKNK